VVPAVIRNKVYFVGTRRRLFSKNQKRQASQKKLPARFNRVDFISQVYPMDLQGNSLALSAFYKSLLWGTESRPIYYANHQ
jgi:hypothetical protein